MNGNNSGELEKGIRTCDELLRLSRAQHDAIVEDDVDRLQALIEYRERLLASFDLRAATAVMGGLRSSLSSGPEADGRSLLMDKIKELIRIDEKNGKLLLSRVTQLRIQLVEIRRGCRALHEYASLGRRAESVYIDKLR